MNWEQVAGNWKEFKGRVRSKWGKFTDDDLEQIAGKKDMLVGRLQQHYGLKKDQAEKQIDEFIAGEADVPEEEEVDEDDTLS